MVRRRGRQPQRDGGRLVPPRSGESTWKQALPLLRLKGERVYSESQVDVIAPNMFAGSVLDLEPDTPYDVQFVLTDPDGVRGESRRTLAVRTRPEPTPYAGGRVFHVYPHGFTGTEDRAVVRRVDVCLQLLVRRHRLGDLRPASRQARRHDSGARGHLQVQPLRVHEQRLGQPDRAARRHLLPDR